MYDTTAREEEIAEVAALRVELPERTTGSQEVRFSGGEKSERRRVPEGNQSKGTRNDNDVMNKGG